jgi:hypothetical protein
MINFARQAYVNPFLSAVGAPFGGVNPPTWDQQMGGLVPTQFSYLPMTVQFGQYNPLTQFAAGIVPGLNPGVNPMTTQFGQYNPLLSQIAGGVTGINHAGVPTTAQFGQFNPLVPRFAGGFGPTINPFIAQTATNWPTHFNPQFSQGVGRTPGYEAYGIDPRVAFGATGQQFGFTDPNVGAGLNNPGIAGDPIALLMSQQLNPLVHQQLPIRPLINAPQNTGVQPNISGANFSGPNISGQNLPGIGFPVTQWPVAQPVAQLDAYRAFLEAQLISQLAANPLYQLQHQVQRGYGAPETAGLGVPGVGQQFNPLYGNVPFYG